jgi:hypothetical protein
LGEVGVSLPIGTEKVLVFAIRNGFHNRRERTITLAVWKVQSDTDPSSVAHGDEDASIDPYGIKVLRGHRDRRRLG